MFSIFLWNYVRKIMNLGNNMIYSLKQVVKELVFFYIIPVQFHTFFSMASNALPICFFKERIHY